MHTHGYTHTHTHGMDTMPQHTHACTDGRTHARTLTHTHTHAHTHTYTTHTHTLTHTHTHSQVYGAECGEVVVHAAQKSVRWLEPVALSGWRFVRDRNSSAETQLTAQASRLHLQEPPSLTVRTD